MNILDFDHKEHEEVLNIVGETMQDLNMHIEKSYQSLLFLGNNINSGDKDLLDLAIFNIRLCYVYYMKREDYEKLAEIKKVADMINSSSKSIVDRILIDKIDVNLN